MWRARPSNGRLPNGRARRDNHQQLNHIQTFIFDILLLLLPFQVSSVTSLWPALEVLFDYVMLINCLPGLAVYACAHLDTTSSRGQPRPTLLYACRSARTWPA